MDTYLRGIYLVVWASDEVLNPLKLSSQHIWMIIVVTSVIILLSLTYFVHYVYLYKDLLYVHEDTTAQPLRGQVVRMTRKIRPLFYFVTSSIIIIVISLTLILCNPKVTLKQPIYQDCEKVWGNAQKDGVYPIYANSERTKIKYTTCVKGKTLIQKTNPDAMNRRRYFKRNMRQYEEGFGFNAREMFIGLETIHYLNGMGLQC